MSPTIDCVSCENAIETGEYRQPTADGIKHDYCQLHDTLFNKYGFSILNPPREGYHISFWREYDDKKEFPVISMGDDGMVAVCSASSMHDQSQNMTPSEGFFKAIAYATHSLLAFDPFGVGISDFEDRVKKESEDHIELFYDEVPPEHEKRTIETVVAQLLPHTAPYVIQELKPIRDFAAEYTEFRLPPAQNNL